MQRPDSPCPGNKPLGPNAWRFNRLILKLHTPSHWQGPGVVSLFDVEAALCRQLAR